MTKLSVSFAVAISSDSLKEIDNGFCVGTSDGKLFVPNVIINDMESENLKEQLYDIVDRLISLATDKEELNTKIKSFSNEENNND